MQVSPVSLIALLISLIGNVSGFTVNGRYKLVSSENFNEALQELGIGFFQRFLAGMANPVVHFATLGEGKYNVKAVTAFKTSEYTFEINKPFEKERMDGAMVTTVVTLEGNKFIEVESGPAVDGKVVQITREFVGNTLNVTFRVNNVICHRVYERIED